MQLSFLFFSYDCVCFVKVFLAHGLKRMPRGEQCGAIGEMSEVILMSTSDRSLQQKVLKAPRGSLHEKTERRHRAVSLKHKNIWQTSSWEIMCQSCDRLALVARCRICCSRRINTSRVGLKRLGSICSLLKPLYYAKSSFNYNETRQGEDPGKDRRGWHQIPINATENTKDSMKKKK